MVELNDAELRGILTRVKDPEDNGLLSEKADIGAIHQKSGNIQVVLNVSPEDGPKLNGLRKAAEDALKSITGVLSAVVVLTAERAPGTTASQPAPTTATAAAPGQRPQPRSGPDIGPQSGPNASPFASTDERRIPGIDKMIAIASGKGGVGKSTTAVNLALALSRLGFKIGVLDADIYGPSIPKMMGLSGHPETVDDKLQPLNNHGIKTMSMGFMVDPDQPIIWRGPMAMGALEQMLKDVAWGELDYLIVDLPPGTGDVQLSLAQRAPVSGAIIVSTPQDVALADARKGLNMFRKVNVPILGLIENMSYFLCPNCDDRHHIFGNGGAKAMAAELDCPFLGEIPLTMQLRETSDDGTPIVVADPENAEAKAYLAIAEKISSLSL